MSSVFLPPACHVHAGTLQLPHAKDIRGFRRIRTVDGCEYLSMSVAKQYVDTLFDCELSVCHPAWAAEVFQGRAREFLCACVCGRQPCTGKHAWKTVCACVEGHAAGAAQQQYLVALRPACGTSRHEDDICVALFVYIYRCGLAQVCGCSALLPNVPCALAVGAVLSMCADVWSWPGFKGLHLGAVPCHTPSFGQSVEPLLWCSLSHQHNHTLACSALTQVAHVCCHSSMATQLRRLALTNHRQDVVWRDWEHRSWKPVLCAGPPHPLCEPQPAHVCILLGTKQAA